MYVNRPTITMIACFRHCAQDKSTALGPMSEVNRPLWISLYSQAWRTVSRCI